MNAPVYMDYHATTPVDERVVDAMLPFFTASFGNPASRQHRFGWVAEQAVEAARGTLARLIGAQQREIVLTSGATEANNLALKGYAEASKRPGAHIITVQTEHKSVLDSSRRLEKAGYRVTYLPVDPDGLVDLNRIAEAITPETILVSVMMANNEIGTVQPVGEIGALCHEHQIVFHTDATQAVGMLPVNVETMKIDLLSCSGHKIYGPKGVGLLYVRSTAPKVRLAPLLDGGGHERGMRSGTLNVPGIVGLAKALELCVEGQAAERARLAGLRDRLWSHLRDALGDVALNGHPVQRLPQNLNVSFLHVEDNALMMSMKDVAVSTGSACSTADPEPSHVLKALRLPPERLHSALRFGLGRFTTEAEVDYVAQRVVESVRNLRQLSPTYHSSTVSEGIPHERS
jgi:cysteine desulfurase